MFQALANPNRIRIYRQLLQCAIDAGCCGSTCVIVDEMQLSVGEVKTGLEVGASTVSHHLKELRQAGLIQMGRCGRTVSCCIDPQASRELAGFFLQDSSQPTSACCTPGKQSSKKGG